MKTRLLITVGGIVQGVGFRPFVLRSARALGLCGSVSNGPDGVRIVCEGDRDSCLALVRQIQESPPVGALVLSVCTAEEMPQGEDSFRILASSDGRMNTAISPDLGICPDCARELMDPADRRYRYPFLNCTACGPRFTIIKNVPYDRANTTMSAFPMCDACQTEYETPENRRFHAEPTACADCGPRLRWLEAGREMSGDPIARFRDAIGDGKIVAVRGLGGFHLACDARDAAAVSRLRTLKRRYEKPFALMVRDIGEAERLCVISPQEREELLSARRPIVLLTARPDNGIAREAAPDQRRLGIMLPYTPLHLLLLQDAPPLVMTSANVSDAPMPFADGSEPMVAALSDAVLTHNRPILRRMDDSVCVFAQGKRRLIRRARGFVPQPLPMPGARREPLAMGGQSKATFCLVKDGMAYLSGHMGDLDNAEALADYERELSSFLRLFDAQPQCVACDMHPDYASTHLAVQMVREHPDMRILQVQHHHAHFASVLCEHSLPSAQGFVWDGSGLGGDGTLFGGEQFTGTCAGVERIGHLRPLCLPGGEAAIHEPWRVALSAVAQACGEETALRLFAKQPQAPLMLQIASKAALSPYATGMGRLFDAVAALSGLSWVAGYEGQAAIRLEQAFDDGAQGRYAFDISRDARGLAEWDWRPVVRDAARDVLGGASCGVVSAKFHRALIALVCQTALPNCDVALSGGVFQNVRLLEGCTAALEAAGHRVFANELVPSGDGGLSYGQAAVAASLEGG